MNGDILKNDFIWSITKISKSNVSCLRKAVPDISLSCMITDHICINRQRWHRPLSQCGTDTWGYTQSLPLAASRKCHSGGFPTSNVYTQHRSREWALALCETALYSQPNLLQHFWNAESDDFERYWISPVGHLHQTSPCVRTPFISAGVLKHKQSELIFHFNKARGRYAHVWQHEQKWVRTEWCRVQFG